MSNLQPYIGIIGTLLGVIITFTLNYIVKVKGKIYFYFKNYNIYFNKLENGCYVESNVLEARDFRYRLGIEIFNSSEVPKILREINIKFEKDKRHIECTPYTSLSLADHFRGEELKTISNINLPPKQIVSYNLSVTKENDIEFFKGKIRVYFECRTHKNKVIKKFVQDINFDT